MSYYRYYTAGQANGYTHGMHYVFTPQSYARLTAALGTNLSSLTDAQVAPYADNGFPYNSLAPRNRAVTRPSTATPAAGTIATPAWERSHRGTSRCNSLQSLQSLHQDGSRCIKGGRGAMQRPQGKS